MSEITLYAEHVRTVTIVEAKTIRYSVDDTRYIERLCRDAGWKIGEWHGNIAILPFTDMEGNYRLVSIAARGDGLLMFGAYSYANLPPRQVSQGLLTFFRNQGAAGGTIGRWQAVPCDRNNVRFTVQFVASMDRLDGPKVGYICNELLLEVMAVDFALWKSGLLRYPKRK